MTISFSPSGKSGASTEKRNRRFLRSRKGVVLYQITDKMVLILQSLKPRIRILFQGRKVTGQILTLQFQDRSCIKAICLNVEFLELSVLTLCSFNIQLCRSVGDLEIGSERSVIARDIRK